MKRFSYAFRQAFSQVFRNRNMSTASVFSITAMMIILGIFLVITLNVNLFAQSIEDQFDTIEVYLEDDITDTQGIKITEEIAKVSHVASAEYVSRDDAMTEMKQRWGENAYLLDGLSGNPFPPSVEITSDDLKNEASIVEEVQKIEGVEEVKFYQDIINRLMKISRYIEIGAVSLICILIVVSIIVVNNTVKLTVHAREDEILIMKYVGATNWFVRAPFFIEGIIIGLLSSVVAAAIVGLAYYKVVDAFAERILILFSTGLVPVQFIMINLSIIFVALGVSIGSIGSILSMRRFLDA